jgi:hypothetical protein
MHQQTRSNVGRGCAPLCHPPGASRRAWESCGAPSGAVATRASGHLPGPGTDLGGPRLQPEVRKRRRALTPGRVGWQEGGKGARGWGGNWGTGWTPRTQVRGGEREGAKEGAGPGAPAIVAGLPGPPLRPGPRGPRSLLGPRPGAVRGGAGTRTSCHPGRERDRDRDPAGGRPSGAGIVPRAPPTSRRPRFQRLRVPGSGLRAPGSGSAAGEGAAAPG